MLEGIHGHEGGVLVGIHGEMIMRGPGVLVGVHTYVHGEMVMRGPGVLVGVHTW